MFFINSNDNAKIAVYDLNPSEKKNNCISSWLAFVSQNV